MATTPQSIPPLAKQGWYRRNEIAVTPWLFLVPGLIMFAIYVIFPIFQSFRISLYKWDGLGTLFTQSDSTSPIHILRCRLSYPSYARLSPRPQTT